VRDRVEEEAMVPLLAALVLALAADIHVVDDNGPADFTDIQSAIDAAHAGDTLVVKVGAYAGFTLGKRLTIVGQDGPLEPFVGTEPYVGGTVLIDGAALVTLAGFRVFDLRLEGVPGLALVDDCTVLRGITVTHCAQLTLSRIDVPQAQTDVPALLVEDATVTLVDSRLTGGAGISPFAGSGGPGRAALNARSGSFVLVAGSSLEGGDAGQGSSQDGPVGDAIECFASAVLVRGSSTDVLDDGDFDPGFGGVPGHAIECTGGFVLHSGVTLAADVEALAGGTIVEAPAPEPYLEITGSDQPGEQRSIDLYGPAGATGLLLFSTGAGHVELPKLELPLLLDLSPLLLALPLVMVGQDTPLSLAVSLPAAPGLQGFALHVQAVFPAIPSTWQPGKQLVTNHAPLVVRF
jgi:hypothetical protein